MLTYSVDNGGHIVPCHPNCSDPVAATGQTLDCDTTDKNIEVVPGQKYAVTIADNGGHDVVWFGVADASDAANRIWIGEAGHTIVINIPINCTALHYASNADNTVAYLRRLN